MSVLKTPEAVPSRVMAVFKHMLAMQERTVTRDELEAELSPPSLRREGNIVSKVVPECLKMGMLDMDGAGVVTLRPDALELYGQDGFDETAVRRLLLGLFTNGDVDENHDICRVIAWLMVQDPAARAWDYESTRDALGQQVGDGVLELSNDVRWQQLRYWMVYFGFAWAHSARGTLHLVPDPTVYVRRALDDLLTDTAGKRMPISVLLERLASRCPVLPGGAFSIRLRDARGDVETVGVSPALALALLRLHRTHHLELLRQDDAPNVVLTVGGQPQGQYTHVALPDARHADAAGGAY